MDREKVGEYADRQLKESEFQTRPKSASSHRSRPALIPWPASSNLEADEEILCAFDFGP